jgi:hypothetical protein
VTHILQSLDQSILHLFLQDSGIIVAFGSIIEVFSDRLLIQPWRVEQVQANSGVIDRTTLQRRWRQFARWRAFAGTGFYPNRRGNISDLCTRAADRARTGTERIFIFMGETIDLHWLFN